MVCVWCACLCVCVLVEDQCVDCSAIVLYCMADKRCMIPLLVPVHPAAMRMKTFAALLSHGDLNVFTVAGFQNSCHC